ncbi:crotonobetainyl-CoA:carnitine CoA-transferase CaiB-like acyl-CoA transferase [Muricomes intestini]|uniref:Crotonobetainyl-CoA:carnitine CoA-transferase CaiB-like acyl-CoA transferase n=1 Tax=Muricomes intestini TaxID=1796634 RepID=A0A4R3KER8_9FIRM|nr:CoA transferase [Muricomes intestini]TCS81757.1 crotonobetainyl-CoA:carnitine CoA-transferase CaiB-like acyl-CoA transferase [Muricomes intestini]
MSERKFLIPEFGPFAGMRIITSGSLVAMPFAATLLADFGAEVIHIERPGVGDTLRVLAPFAKEGEKTVSTSWAQDGRNKLSLSLELNLKHPEVKELFYNLIQEADVFMENMVWLAKLGIYDEELLKVNPKLIIVHVSGYGTPEFGGVPAYCDRASYDMIGQAFSGWMYLQGEPGGDPVVAKPWMNDFVSAYAALFGVLAAYHSMLKTGKGQVVDVAQFEAQAMYMCDTFTSYTMAGVIRERSGNNAAAFQPYGLFKSKDGYDIALGAFGPGVYKRFVQGVGFDLEYYNYKETSSGVMAVNSDKGKEFNKKVVDWCAERTAQEIEDAMQAVKVPCSRVNSVKDCLENEHFQKRGDFIQYEDQTLGKEITAFGIAPKLSETPGKVWRGAPALGQDTNAILKEILGYDDEKINILQEKNLI